MIPSRDDKDNKIVLYFDTPIITKVIRNVKHTFLDKVSPIHSIEILLLELSNISAVCNRWDSQESFKNI